jgi:hypothetical protein
LSLILSGLVIANLGPEWDTPTDTGSSDEFSNVDLIVGICLFVGLPAAAIAVIAFIASSGASEGSATPDSSFRSDRKIAAIVKAVCFGALMLWTIGPTLTRSAYGAFTVAVIAQRLRGKMPLRPMRVLHEAYRLGLLRTVGPAYQFRHAELQDHLAPPRSD